MTLDRPDSFPNMIIYWGYENILLALKNEIYDMFGGYKSQGRCFCMHSQVTQAAALNRKGGDRHNKIDNIKLHCTVYISHAFVSLDCLNKE